MGYSLWDRKESDTTERLTLSVASCLAGYAILGILLLLPCNTSAFFYLLFSALPDLYCFMGAKMFQSCLTLCDPIDCRPPGSSVHGILQIRILE